MIKVKIPNALKIKNNKKKNSNNIHHQHHQGAKEHEEMAQNYNPLAIFLNGLSTLKFFFPLFCSFFLFDYSSIFFFFTIYIKIRILLWEKKEIFRILT